MAKKKSSTGANEPWDRPNPRKNAKKLTPTGKASGKRRAEKAGRTYPNLVDNMHAASRGKKRSSK